jgi:hypothetical protein
MIEIRSTQRQRYPHNRHALAARHDQAGAHFNGVTVANAEFGSRNAATRRPVRFTALAPAVSAGGSSLYRVV